MNIKLVSSLSGLFILMFSLANCSKAGFSNSDGAAVSAKSSNSDNLNLADDDSDDPVLADNDDDDDDHKNCGKDKDSDDAAAVSPVASDFVACFIAGSSSLKLGISNDQLTFVNSVSKSICIPKSVCLNLIPAISGITTSADRGYCEHNKNVLRLSLSQIQKYL